jgi:alkylation response protein AidB-like acyl-CoA dehydrogenase
MNHPRDILAPELVNSIRSHTLASDQSGSLAPEVLEIIYRNRWFQLMVPRFCGGSELSLPETVRLFEALAWADANVGWCVNLGAGANMFSGYFDEQTALSIFESPRTCCAGSGAISGTAIQAEGGYSVSGRWKYASGANHATHFTANARILDRNNQSVMENGEPAFRSFIFPATGVLNYRNWNAIGLKASSSNDFEVKEVWVPQQHTFSLVRPSVFAEGPLYKFSFATLAVVNMACMSTGIALQFLDLYNELARHKKPLHSDELLQDNQAACRIVEQVAGAFTTARKEMYILLQEVWDIYAAGQYADDDIRGKLEHAARAAAAAARTVMNEIYPLCGMSIVDPGSLLNKVWRDAATASQHYLLSPVHN